MLRFAVRRIMLMIPVLFGLSVLLFAWLRALPGDPARALLGEKATPEAIARINEQYGFDQPLLQQYVTYVGQLVRGDFGSSPRTVNKHLEQIYAKLGVENRASAALKAAGALREG